MRRLACLLMLVAGCSPTINATPPVTSTTSTVPASTTSSTAVSDIEVAPCLAGAQEFIQAGSIPLGTGVSGDARLISGWSIIQEQGCERFEVSLAAEGGAPATTPGSVEAEVIDELGIVRLWLDPGVVSTAVVDHEFETGLVDSAYTVRSIDGGVFIDVHLAAGAAARAHLERSPASVVIDLIPVEGGTGSAAIGDRIVVTAPAGQLAVFPLFVRGYSRTSAGNVTARLVKEGREPVEASAAAADYLQMWGEFEVVFQEGPGGPVVLQVGYLSPESGAFEAVELPIVIS